MRRNGLFMAVTALCCYLGIYQGHLALWHPSGLKPERVFPYRVSLFTCKDRADLESGIHFSSDAELSRLLEDYLS